MSAMKICIDGIGLWSAQLDGLDALRRVFEGHAPVPPSGKPPAVTLPANERRRAPEIVLLAAEVAGQAVAMSGRSAAELACVFASSQGDQAITDYMCATLAQAPAELSPTRFHNSVHNAPAGYWTIATHCHAPSTAVTAHRHSFGAGLLEAATQVLAERHAVLLVCSDVAGCGPLGDVTDCPELFGSALVLTPEPGPATLARLEWMLIPGRAPAAPLPAPLDAWRQASPAAAALDLLAPLAQRDGTCRIMTSEHLQLQARLEYPA
jgi:hypothetical protein